jgi:hypothetical protein
VHNSRIISYSKLIQSASHTLLNILRTPWTNDQLSNNYTKLICQWTKLPINQSANQSINQPIILFQQLRTKQVSNKEQDELRVHCIALGPHIGNACGARIRNGFRTRLACGVVPPPPTFCSTSVDDLHFNQLRSRPGSRSAPHPPPPHSHYTTF